MEPRDGSQIRGPGPPWGCQERLQGVDDWVELLGRHSDEHPPGLGLGCPVCVEAGEGCALGAGVPRDGPVCVGRAGIPGIVEQGRQDAGVKDLVGGVEGAAQEGERGVGIGAVGQRHWQRPHRGEEDRGHRPRQVRRRRGGEGGEGGGGRGLASVLPGPCRRGSGRHRSRRRNVSAAAATVPGPETVAGFTRHGRAAAAIPPEDRIGAEAQEVDPLAGVAALQDPLEEDGGMDARGRIGRGQRAQQLRISAVHGDGAGLGRLAQVGEGLEAEEGEGAGEGPREGREGGAGLLGREGDAGHPVEPPSAVEGTDEEGRPRPLPAAARPPRAAAATATAQHPIGLEAVQGPDDPAEEGQVGAHGAAEEQNVGGAPVVGGAEARDRSLETAVFGAGSGSPRR